ncbi:MAG: hypothetical protein JRJ75_16705, partial [Deltaproteobacteria bacterium]|nr:hypothetical protein [Deltaproteobacteria bacterium]
MGRPKKEVAEARRRLKEDEELLRKRKEALRLLLDKGIELMRAGKVTEGRMCLKQAEEALQSLGIAGKPDKGQEKEKEKIWQPFLSKVAEDIQGMTKKQYEREMSKDEKLFDTTIEITPEMLGLPREKKEEAEEKEKEDRP